MGMFDSVTVSCPECGDLVDQQSKAGRRNLAVFTLDNAPLEILLDIAKDTIFCTKGHRFYVQLKVIHSAHTIAGDNPITWEGHD